MDVAVRLLLNASVFLLVSQLVPGFAVRTFAAAIWSALIFGAINSLVRPILLLITFPLSILSLGIFTLVIDAVVMGITAWLVPGFSIAGFWPAVLGWFLVSGGSIIASALTGGGQKRAL